MHYLMILKYLRDQRGVISVEWIILTIVILAAIVAAFAPILNTALTAGVTSISNGLSTAAGGS